MGGRVAPMEYLITTLDQDRRVVLAGTGSGVVATDDISFHATASGGTAIEYVADIRLKGILSLLTPFAGGAFRKIAANARSGMERALDEMARTSNAPVDAR
jgi:hypothetical protein